MIALVGCTQEAQPSTTSPELSIPTGPVKEFNMVAKQWEFEPSVIQVNKGDTVRLHINSIDVTHGFSMPDFGINVDLEPGKTVDVEFTADKQGRFTFACSVFCGEGHAAMRGQVVVR